MALFRAMEGRRSPAQQLFSDAYAIHFLPRRLQWAVHLFNLPVMRPVLAFYIRQTIPGAMSSAQARTRYIDDWLLRTLQQGVQQVMLLGAGFDTRALRLPQLQQVPVIEMDHPNTARAKLAVLQQLLPALPPNIRYLQIDFNHQSLEQLWAQQQVNCQLLTTVIWEGVTNYLEQAAIDATFASLSLLPAGSFVLFTYIDAAVLSHPEQFYGAVQLLRNLEQIEESWTSGFHPQQLAGYLEKNGFVLLEDLDATAYRARYIPGRTSDKKGYTFYRTAIARKQ